jgi:outer membrane lipoprotein carrier protein
MKIGLLTRMCLGAAVAACVVIQSGAAGSDPSCSEGFRRLAARYRAFEGIRAHFRHTLHATTLNQTEEETGTVFVAPGGRMRWEYDSPKGKLAVADGEKSYLYLPEENQVFEQPLAGEGGAPLALQILSGHLEVLDAFECQRAYALAGETVYHLEPKHADEGITGLEISLADDSGLVTRVFFKDAIGNEVLLSLSEIQAPVKLDPGLFRFTPPKGARILQAGP